MTDNDAELIRASRRPNRTGRHRSQARLWIEAHYDELVAAPPHWPALADRLNGQGKRDAFNRKLTAHSLASMFSRVKAERQVKKPPARTGTRATAPTLPAAEEPIQLRPIRPKETS